MMRRVATLMVAVLATIGAGAVRAQDDAASDYLFNPDVLGRGWEMIAEFPSANDLDPSFRDGSGAVYAGPFGARVVLLTYLIDDGTTAIRRSWEVTNELFDALRSEIDYGFESRRERDLADTPLPDGCTDGRRIYGVERIGLGQFPVGMTLCATDPNLIILVVASGEVNGQTETEASDTVVRQVLRQADRARAFRASPEPAP